MQLDSYADTGVFTSVALVNELVVESGGRAAVAEILAVDPPSLARLRERDVPGFAALARRLQEVFADLRRGDADAAADRLNAMLAEHPASPHLAKEDGRWRLHHHPRELALVPMWTSICAEALARLVGSGYHDRLGSCEAPGCGRVYVDVSKNGSRRFCSTACQNRVKTAAFRRRRSEPL